MRLRYETQSNIPAEEIAPIVTGMDSAFRNFTSARLTLGNVFTGSLFLDFIALSNAVSNITEILQLGHGFVEFIKIAIVKLKNGEGTNSSERVFLEAVLQPIANGRATQVIITSYGNNSPIIIGGAEGGELFNLIRGQRLGDQGLPEIEAQNEREKRILEQTDPRAAYGKVRWIDSRPYVHLAQGGFISAMGVGDSQDGADVEGSLMIDRLTNHMVFKVDASSRSQGGGMASSD